jgi:adenosylmethionine-8-amino-7-oxononanoate aminotransferase
MKTSKFSEEQVVKILEEGEKGEQTVDELCRKHGILLIADEVMTGMGRTGKPFASEHWGLEPDIILTGKGIASGYAPLGAVLVAQRVVEAFEKGSAAFMHGFTYQAHPVATAAGNAVFDYLETHKLFARVTPAGQTLRQALAALENHPHVGQVRGLGLLQGVEFVKDKSTRAPFAKADGIAEKIRQAALEKNVLLYPGQGCVDGLRGDHVLLAPPFIIQPEECLFIADAIQYALAKVFSA